MAQDDVLIIGAGPAGLTAAYELLEHTSYRPIVIEADPWIGGLSRTVCHHGNRMDIGGHRFFSKSDRVTEWWLRFLPQQGAPEPDPAHTDAVMLLRQRLSRILFAGKLFDYPIGLNRTTIANLGLGRMVKIAASYAKARIHPRRPVASLEDFFINHFGEELYATFFRDYTAKVWGVPCREIPPEWGAQRVKQLSLLKIVLHALRYMLPGSRATAQVETSLIDAFLYPKLGPGQLWETAAERIVERGGQVLTGQRVVGIKTDGDRVTGVEIEEAATGVRRSMAGAYVLSSMPVRDLVAAMPAPVPAAVSAVAQGLQYRDFMTVGVLATRLRNPGAASEEAIPDNWIYVQEPERQVGRLQFFHNWSPYLVADPATAWIGMEYFCAEGDAFWSSSDETVADFAIGELAQMGMVDPADVRDSVVIRVPKAYPAYFGTYADFAIVRQYLDRFDNLFLIGRNGMHRYNNIDHSMLTAMAAMEGIANGNCTKAPLWAVNTEEAYLESKGAC